MPNWDDFVEWALEEANADKGRASLRRRWERLRGLAEEVSRQVSAAEVQQLLGKPPSELDPEENDVKALIAYALGKGVLRDPAALRKALDDDRRCDPLSFLAQHSGKSLGETYSKHIAEFWLLRPGDSWANKASTKYYDVGWTPAELHGRELRIELKASSEYPNYRFQQIRHYLLSGSEEPDYDLLLCLGVTARSLEWWAIPTTDLDQLAENGVTPPDRIAIRRHHGKRRPIWNHDWGYSDEGWTQPFKRKVLQPYYCASEELRAAVLALFP